MAVSIMAFTLLGSRLLPRSKRSFGRKTERRSAAWRAACIVSKDPDGHSRCRPSKPKARSSSEAASGIAATDRQEATTRVQDHGLDLDRGTQLCLAGKEPPTEQGLRISGANLRGNVRPCRNPPYAQPDRPWRVFKHPLMVRQAIRPRTPYRL